MYVSLYVYVSEWEKKRKSKWEPLRSVFQVPRLKEKYSSLDLIGRVLCSSGSFKLCVWFCARMKKYSNCHFYYKSKVIKMVQFYGEWVQCVLFLYGFYVSSWPKAPLISCYTAVSLGRAEQKNHRINVHCIWHSCPFAGKGEAGLRSLLCVWWRAQNEVFLQQQYPRHPLQEKSHFFLGGSSLRGRKMHWKNWLSKWIRFKKNGNELGKTATKLRGQRDKVEKLLCSSIHLLSDSEHHWTIIWRSKRLENLSNSEAHKLKL